MSDFSIVQQGSEEPGKSAKSGNVSEFFWSRDSFTLSFFLLLHFR